MSRSWSRGKGLGWRPRPRPDSMARLWKIYTYYRIQKQTVHCLTLCGVQFIYVQLATVWMPAYSATTAVDVDKSACSWFNECAQ